MFPGSAGVAAYLAHGGESKGVSVVRDATSLTLVALAAWLLTAILGINLLRRGKAYRLFLFAMAARAPADPRRPVLRATLMGLHLVCALSGLVLWTAYAMFDRQAYGYGALIMLGTGALLGICVVDRWRNGYGRHARPVEPNQGFPVWSATLHVMVATTTLVLVALITLSQLGS